MKDQQTKILVVDDVKVNVILLESILISEGYVVFTADNGPDGRSIAEEKKPDLILLDYKMPGEDGLEVIRWLKNNATTSSIPVLFITASDDLDTKLKAFEYGALDYIIKPFNAEEVKARVRVHARLSVAVKALVRNQADKIRQIQDAQSSMLVQPEDFRDANFSVHYASVQEAGGDFYDVIPINRKVYGYFVADVAGHDIGTSYITAAVKALLQQNCSHIIHARESMFLVNKVLHEILKDGKYLTACYMNINRLKYEATIINMGHPPIVYLPVDGEACLLELDGDVLGAFPDVIFGEKKINVDSGDRFIMYSDGLIEIADSSEMWVSRVDQILKIADMIRLLPIAEVADVVRKKLVDDENQKLDDDIVIMAIEV